MSAWNGKSDGGSLIADLGCWCRSGGFGLGDEFLEFALDVGAQHLGGEDTVGVDGEVVGDGVDTEE